MIAEVRWGNFVADTLPDQTAEPAPDAGRMPTREYVELSERLDGLTQKVDSLLSILQQLGGLTNNPQNPKS
ncbi:hypothetical protein SFIMM107S_01308 [Streptomyces griseus]